MNSDKSQWKNWGDHPLVVIVTTISSLAGLTALLYSALFSLNSDADPTVTLITSIILILVITSVSLAIGVFIGWRLHRRRMLGLDKVKFGQYDKELDSLQSAMQIDLLAINFAGLFNFDIHLRRAILQSNAKVRILLLHPQCIAFDLYTNKNNEYDIKGMRENTDRAVQTILSIKQDLKHSIQEKGTHEQSAGSLLYEFYDRIPYRGLVITNTAIRYWPYLDHLHPSSSPTYFMTRNDAIGECLVTEFEHLWHTAVQQRVQRYWPIETIISGGQTGVDRAALDWAIDHHIPHEGWCPQGRKAEDGVIDVKYNLIETGSEKYEERTKKNVEISDGTLIFSRKLQLTGGTQATLDFAIQLQKSWMHVTEDDSKESSKNQILEFILKHNIKKLNVAGPRGSEAPGIDIYVTDLLNSVLNLAKR